MIQLLKVYYRVDDHSLTNLPPSLSILFFVRAVAKPFKIKMFLFCLPVATSNRTLNLALLMSIIFALCFFLLQILNRQVFNLLLVTPFYTKIFIKNRVKKSIENHEDVNISDFSDILNDDFLFESIPEIVIRVLIFIGQCTTFKLLKKMRMYHVY